jgi:hypothetical protein
LSDTHAAELADTEAAAAEAAAAANTETEGRARRMGWRPKDEFRGDQSRWTDAQTFIERGEAELPILRERYRTLDDRFARMENEVTPLRREVAETRASAEEMRTVLVDFRERSKRAEEVAYTRARSDLEQRMAIAVDQADKAGYDRAKGELDNLNRQERDNLRDNARAAAAPERKADPEKKPEPAAQTPDPVVVSWVSENPWFNVDPAMAGYATAQFQRMRAEKPGLTTRDHLDAVRADVVARFPEKFENTKRAAPGAVAAPTGAVNAKRKGPPPFEQWPADAKAGFAKAKRWMPDYKPEEYAKIYFTEEM